MDCFSLTHVSQIPCLSDVSGSDSSLPFGHLLLGTRFSEVFATSLSSLEHGRQRTRGHRKSSPALGGNEAHSLCLKETKPDIPANLSNVPQTFGGERVRLDSHAGILEELAGVGYWPHAICVSCRFMEREGGASHNDLTFSSCTSSSPEARVRISEG